MNVRWEDGRLAACTLFKALVANGVQPDRNRFHNLWYDDGELNPNTLRIARGAQPFVIALGKKVSRELTRHGIKHRYLVHPAARGKVRDTREYRRLVKEALAT